ncbi:YvrJ family protein, partial [Clostridium tetani]
RGPIGCSLFIVSYSLNKGGGNMFDEIVMLISNVGFPVAVTTYLLVRLDQRLEELTKAFIDLTRVIEAALEHQEREENLKK